MTSLSSSPCCEYGVGLLGMGCVADVFSNGVSLCSTGVSTIGQIGSPVARSKVYSQPCFVLCVIALRRVPFTVTSMRFGAIGAS